MITTWLKLALMDPTSNTPTPPSLTTPWSQKSFLSMKARAFWMVVSSISIFFPGISSSSFVSFTRMYSRKKPMSNSRSSLEIILNCPIRYTIMQKQPLGPAYKLETVPPLNLEPALNSLGFSYGPQSTKPLDLHLGFCHVPPSAPLPFSPAAPLNFLTLGLKCQRDGRIRDKRPLNIVVVLDISRSMVDTLSQSTKGNQKRLALSQEAILLIYSKLKDSDGFGLMVFDSKAETVIECQRKSTMEKQEVTRVVEGLNATERETKLLVGVRKGVESLKQYLREQEQNNESVVCQNRVVMLTDMTDNMSDADHFIHQVSHSEIHITVVGMSEQFKAETCKKLTQIKGFNYFCAMENGDFNKYVFQNFVYSFFPCAYDLQITLQAENIKQFEVFNTADGHLVKNYNNGFGGSRKHIQGYVISNIKTVFPTPISYEQGQLKKYGGFIIVKIELVEQLGKFSGFIGISYRTITGQSKKEQYQVQYEYKANEAFFSQQQLHQAVNVYRYITQVNIVLKHLNANSQIQPCLEHLQKIQQTTPKHKQQQLKRLISRVKFNLK